MRDHLQSRRLIDLLSQLDALTNWEERPRGGMRVNLAPMADLMVRLDNPHKAFRSVHVAGTKGKSSTTALLEAAIGRAGIPVGRYVSPHIDNICERFCINGKAVSESDLADTIDMSMSAYKEALAEGTDAQTATWFDILTATAFLLFKRAGVRWAIVETGLGGRLDSTNIVPSEVQIITNVALEHTEVLGDTRAQIAFEKAGIIKPRSVVVTPLQADDEAGQVIAHHAAEMATFIQRPTMKEGGTIAENNHAVVKSALSVLSALDAEIGPWLLDSVASQKARLAGRMEDRIARATSGRLVPIVFDGAHVPFNLAAVLNDLRRIHPDQTCVAIVALAEDKDAHGVLEILKQTSTEVIFTTASGRSRSTTELLVMAEEMGIEANREADPGIALGSALDRADAINGWVLVTGSLYLTGILHQHPALETDSISFDQAPDTKALSS